MGLAVNNVIAVLLGLRSNSLKCLKEPLSLLSLACFCECAHKFACSLISPEAIGRKC